MGRPKKQGIDYWPLDVDAANDDKLVEVAAQHGSEAAWYVWTRLNCELYRVGLCYRFSAKDARTAAHKLGMKEDRFVKIVKSCIEAGLYDRRVYEETGFLTSKGIQRRFFYSIRGRKEVSIPDGVLLLSEDDLPDGLTILIKDLLKEKNSTEHISLVSDVETTIKNVETVRNGNKRKIQKKFDPNGKKQYLDNVYLSKEQYEEVKQYYIKQGYGPQVFDKAVQVLDTWFEDNPNMRLKRTNDAKTLKGWPLERALSALSAEARYQKWTD